MNWGLPLAPGGLRVRAEIVDNTGLLPLVCGVPTGWLSRE